MIFIIGLPKQHHSDVLKALMSAVRPEYITGVANVSGMSSSDYFAECLDTLVAFHKGRPDCFDKGLSVVGVTQVGESLRAVLKLFFPFALTKEVQFPTRYASSPAQSSRDRNEMVRLLERELKRQVKAKKLVTTFLASRAARTPVLLPLRHFGEEELHELVTKAWKKLPEVEDPLHFLEAASKSFERKFPFTKRPGAKTGFFRNSKDVWFRPPGRDLHALAHSEVAGHLTSCFFNGTLRIGGAIRAGFHYDCTRGGKRHSGAFQDCHGDTVEMTGKPHLNVYPSDFIR